jgi:hypothetical protein
MAEGNNTAFEVTPVPDAGKPEDLSAEIAGAVERRTGDVVRCTRVGGDNYRCNWWSPEATGGYDNPRMGGLLVTTHRVRKSRFLSVTKAAGRLVIKDRSSRHPAGGNGAGHAAE